MCKGAPNLQFGSSTSIHIKGCGCIWLDSWKSNPNLINIVGAINNSVWRLLLQNTNRSSRRIKKYIPPPFSCIRKGTQSYVGTSFAKSIPCVFLPPRVSSITIIIIIYRGGALRASHEKNENICICSYTYMVSQRRRFPCYCFSLYIESVSTFHPFSSRPFQR